MKEVHGKHLFLMNHRPSAWGDKDNVATMISGGRGYPTSIPRQEGRQAGRVKPPTLNYKQI